MCSFKMGLFNHGVMLGSIEKLDIGWIYWRLFLFILFMGKQGENFIHVLPLVGVFKIEFKIFSIEYLFLHEYIIISPIF